MKGSTEIILEICIISILNILAVYVAAFVYRLNWWGILAVMVVTSLLTAYLSHIFVKKAIERNGTPEFTVSESSALLIITLTTSLAVLIILSFHFNLPMALGISLLSGLETSIWKNILFTHVDFVDKTA